MLANRQFKMKRLIYFILCMCVLVACNERREYKEALAHAQRVMEEHPDSSLSILDTLGRHASDFGSHFRMQHLLASTYAQAKTGLTFETDSVARLLVDHFDGSGSCVEKSLAYYLYGCALSDMGQAPEALQAFYDAIGKADTTRTDCGYNVYNILKGIYGQMSVIFHQQNLPQDEIWALKRYIEYVRKTSSEKDYIIAKMQMIRPYFLMNEMDTILKITHDTYHALMRLGDEQEASAVLVTSIYIYMERGQISEAKKAIDIFERGSGLFDEFGNISSGREGYYYIKGFFELASKNIDAAEYYFRKSIQYGYFSEGYKGLLRIYREKNVIDSVLHYSELYEAAQDTLHNKMQTDAIHQMAALYNYSRSQKEAEIARDNARRNGRLAIFITIAAIILLGGFFLYYRRNTKRRKQRLAALERDLNMAKVTRTEIFEELQQLKARNYEGIIVAKEARLAELTESIEQLQAENETLRKGSAVREKDHLEQFLNSDIAKLFVRKATEKTERVEPTEAEWKMLISQFSQDNPATYKAFGSGKPLSKLERRICILLVLDISENVISIMTESSTSTVSNLKARSNEKLFGKKEARSLKINLIHALKTI